MGTVAVERNPHQRSLRLPPCFLLITSPKLKAVRSGAMRVCSSTSLSVIQKPPKNDNSSREIFLNEIQGGDRWSIMSNVRRHDWASTHISRSRYYFSCPRVEWSLACVAHVLCSSHFPFQGFTLPAFFLLIVQCGFFSPMVSHWYASSSRLGSGDGHVLES